MAPRVNPIHHAIHYSPAGFSLLKSQPSGPFIVETYKSTTLSTLQRECGSFFDTPAEQTLVSLNFTAPFLVPKALYQAPASQYLKMQQEVSDSAEVFEDDLGEYVAIYALPLSKTLPLRTTLRNPKFHHTATLLYRYLAQYESELPNKMLLHFSGNRMGFILIKNGKLFIINELTFTTKEDALYYVLHILQQQEARRDETEVLITGDTPDLKEIVQLLGRCLPHVQGAGKKERVVNVKGQKEPAFVYIQLIGIQ
jgi:hypothetical protein